MQVKKTKNMPGRLCFPCFRVPHLHIAGEDKYHDIKYIRLNNTPGHKAVQEKLAQVAGGEDAVVTASGMAAITTALLTVLKKGDHLLAQNCLYGGTQSFLARNIADFGIDVDFVPANEPDEWEKRLRPETRAIYVETMSNPLLEVADLSSVVAFARSHRLISMIDNTFASPVNFRPLDMGFDLSLHSCTKYLNGHSDIVAGCVIGNNDLITRITHRLNLMGGCLDPHALFSITAWPEDFGTARGKAKRKRTRVSFFFGSSPGRGACELSGLVQPSATQPRKNAL